MESTQPGNSNVFDTVASAVAELDRRDAAREPAAKVEAEDAEETDSPSNVAEDESEVEEVATEAEAEPEEQAATSIEFDGKTLEIPKGTPPALVEAVQKLGNDLKADYTRKTQAVAADRQAIESAKRQTMETFQQLQTTQAALAQMAHALIPQEPDLSLAQTSPHEFLLAKTQHERATRQFDHLMQQGQQLTAQQQQAANEQANQYQAAEAEALFKAIPELTKPEKLTAFRNKVIDAGGVYGFKPEEISALKDHRMVLALRDLAKFQAQAKQGGELKTKLQNVAPKAASPGATTTQAPASAKFADAKREFMKSARTDRDLRRYLAQTS